MIWCTNHSNVHIHNFRICWNFIWRCFFPVSILNPLESNRYIFVPINKNPIFQPIRNRNSPKFHLCSLEIATEQLQKILIGWHSSKKNFYRFKNRNHCSWTKWPKVEILLYVVPTKETKLPTHDIIDAIFKESSSSDGGGFCNSSIEEESDFDGDGEEVPRTLFQIVNRASGWVFWNYCQMKNVTVMIVMILDDSDDAWR